MNSFNDTLVYHWPFPLKHTQKKTALLKKETAYRLGVKFPNELNLDAKFLGAPSRHHPKGKTFPKSTSNQKVVESRSIIDNFNAHPSLKHRHCGRALGAVPARSTDTVARKTNDLSTSNNGADDDCQLSLSQLRTLFPPSLVTSTSKMTTATRLSQCDSPTYCPMNPYRTVHNSTLSSAHLLLNLRRQQELIDRLNRCNLLKHHVPSLAVTSSRHSGNLAKSDMAINSSRHCNHHLNLPGTLRSFSYVDRSVNNYPPPPPLPPQGLGWRSKSEVLQLPAVDFMVTSTASVATVTMSNQENPVHISRPSRRPAYHKCKKPDQPIKYTDPWKGGGRLYHKRLSDLATMVTETLIWEKSKQHKKAKQGSNSTLFG